MNKKKLTILIIIIFLVVGFGFFSKTNADPTSYTLTGYAWSDNIGWISFEDSDVNLDILTGDFSGYAWSDNIGWLDFAPTTGYPQDPQHSVMLESDGVTVTGWARALSNGDGWDGWISFDGSSPNYGVSIDRLAGSMSGFAWGDEVVGWVDFNGVGLAENITVVLGANIDVVNEINEGEGVNISVLVNDTGDGIFIQSVGLDMAPINGIVTDNGDGTIRYTNTTYSAGGVNFGAGVGVGSDAFSYTIVDSFGNTVTSYVVITLVWPCGNGIIEGTEDCDDGSGNNVFPASCSLSCTLNSLNAVCGNNICEVGESFFTCPGDCSSVYEEF